MSVNNPGGTPTPEGKPTDENNAPNPKMYTEEEVKLKFRGQGKRLSEVEAENAKLADELAKFKAVEAEKERKNLEDKGQYNTVIERKDAELKAALDKAAALEAYKISKEEAEKAKLAKMQEENEARLKALPKDWQDLVPAELPTEAMANYLNKIEAKYQANAIHIKGAPGNSQPENKTHEGRMAELQARSEAKVLGKKVN